MSWSIAASKSNSCAVGSSYDRRSHVVALLPTREDTLPLLQHAVDVLSIESTMSLYTIYQFVLLMCMEIGHALRRQTAGQFGPELAKKLSQLVKMEKNVMRSMELVGRERMEVAVSSSLPSGPSDAREVPC